MTTAPFAEVLNSSDVSNGVVNILTGHKKELLSHLSNHMDVNAVVYCGNNAAEITSIQELASLNVKRPLIYTENNWMKEESQNPYRIMDLQEIKTTWHPIGQ